jgi:HD-GYP domain-containing protein (c-di-GMP phosphodiesterase class II)
MRTVPFRINLISHFFALLLITSGSLIYVQYLFNDKLAGQAADQAFEHILDGLKNYQNHQYEQTKAFLDIIETYPDLDRPVKLDTAHSLQAPFIQVLKQNINAYAIYWANLHGDFFEVINMHYSPVLVSQLKAPANTRWGFIKLSRDTDYKIKHYQFFDDKMQLLGIRDEATDYRPYQRPWFLQAQHHPGVIRTPPYLFQHLQMQGITYAKYLPKPGVVIAVDYTSQEIQAFLKSSKPSANSAIFLFDEKGQRLLDSLDNGDNGQRQLAAQLYEKLRPGLHENNTQTARRLVLNGQTYVARAAFGNGDGEAAINIAMLIPLEELTAPYRQQLQLSLLVAGVIFLLLVPVIFLLARMITRPVNALMEENRKIEKRQFTEVRAVPTVIKELARLSDSLVGMSHSIQAYERSQTELMDAIIRLIADAIDAKSPYTGGHCKRVPELAFMLLQATHDDQTRFKDFRFDDPDELRAFHIGAWLHDCGKVTTPEYVVDKATKLETLYNRIHEIRTRFEVLWRDADIAYYQALLRGEGKAQAEQRRQTQQAGLRDDFALVAKANIGGEYLDDAAIARLQQIAKRTWQRHFDKTLGLSEDERRRTPADDTLPISEFLLADKPEHRVPREHFDYEDYAAHGFKEPVPDCLYDLGELRNLSIAKGTLTEEERFKIKEHVMMTIKMLEKLPLPAIYRNVPRYAGTHHETLDGKGYPRQLTAEDLSIPERIMVIADVFEALTAADRPYKPAKTLAEALAIMAKMRDDCHLDAQLFAVFIESGVYLDYARAYLNPEQIEPINPHDYIDYA